jgi:hypothetical protein
MPVQAIRDPGTYKHNGSNISKWAAHYGHHWVGTDKVLVNGQELSKEGPEWQKVSKRIFSGKKGISSDWRYDRKGFHEIPLIKWKKLQATHKREATGFCFLEVITAQVGPLGMSRHAFMRLENEGGYVKSVGFGGATKYPFCWRRGAIISPDNKEVVRPKGHRVTRIKITREEYNALKNRIESDKNRGNEAFHLFHRNCSAWVAEILRDVLKIEVNNREYPEQVILRKVLYKMGIKSINQTAVKVLHFVASFIRLILSPFWFLVWVATGAPFIQRDPLAAEAYRKTFEGKQITVKEFCYRIITVDFMRVFTGWRLSVWQDLIAEKYGKEVISPEQAANVQLGNEMAFAPEGEALPQQGDPLTDDDEDDLPVAPLPQFAEEV